MIEKNELRDALLAMPMREWQRVPVMVARHKWLVKMYRYGASSYFFGFASPRGRMYLYWTSHGRVTGAEIAFANGDTIADYREIWGDKPERLDDVLRLTPKHIINRLIMLLDAIR